jgi:hypothetical protein
MKTLTEYLSFHTKTHRAYVHITPQVEEIVRNSSVKEGMVLVSAMHITAGVYVNDNESGLIEDIDQWLEHLAPFRNDYKHHDTSEDNSRNTASGYPGFFKLPLSNLWFSTEFNAVPSPGKLTGQIAAPRMLTVLLQPEWPAAAFWPMVSIPGRG